MTLQQIRGLEGIRVHMPHAGGDEPRALLLAAAGSCICPTQVGKYIKFFRGRKNEMVLD